MSEVVPVALGARAYDVHIGAGVLARAGELIAPLAPNKRVFVVTDDNVAALHLDALEEACVAAGLTSDTIVIKPGEPQKSFFGLEHLCGALLQGNIERNDIVVAFGGGVIGDLTGLASGLVKRGVGFVQIPTTLLAQVDSSVGGKTAIDTAEGKNLVGLFHQPRLVLADLGVLTTLPERELRAGLAEIVKIALTNDADLLAMVAASAALMEDMRAVSVPRPAPTTPRVRGSFLHRVRYSTDEVDGRARAPEPLGAQHRSAVRGQVLDVGDESPAREVVVERDHVRAREHHAVDRVAALDRTGHPDEQPGGQGL